MNAEKKTIKVVAAFMRRENRFYAARRAYGFLTGKWEFPGGKVEPGEALEDAIKREIKEELDTDISVEGFACNVIYEYPDFILDMDVFYCVPIQGRLSVHAGIHTKERYFAFEECKEDEWCPADWNVINALKSKNR